jgi:hypothetical protein
MSLLSADITKNRRLSLKEVKLPATERRAEAIIYQKIEKPDQTEELILLQKREIIDTALSKFVKIADLDFTLNFVINSLLDKGYSFTNKEYDYFELKTNKLK